MMFGLSELIDLMSIGTLLAYTLVAVSVIVLRFEFYKNRTSQLVIFKINFEF